MKRRLLAALTLCALLCTGGCARLLERDHSSVTPHSSTPAAEENSSALRVERYQELVNALVYLITAGRGTGDVRLYMDGDTVEDTLERACLEVVKEDPLGAYAVDFITYSVTPAVACYEADIQITYRRTPEQISAVVAATGATAIRGELKKALAAFAPESVLRISYFEEDEDYIRALAWEAYCADPTYALGMPQVDIAVYPDSGRQRIVELTLTYPLTPSELEERRTALDRKAQGLVSVLEAGKGERELLAVARQIRVLGGYEPDGGSTAYDALLGGGADSEGLALAMTLLCQRLGGSAQVVKGTLKGETRCWNVVQTDVGWRHLDLTRGEDSAKAFRSDEELTALGYKWEGENVPACPASPSGGARRN